jgi:hypothetical protein
MPGQHQVAPAQVDLKPLLGSKSCMIGHLYYTEVAEDMEGVHGVGIIGGRRNVTMDIRPVFAALTG